MIDLGRHPVLGVPIAAVDYEAAATRLLDAAAEGRPMSATCAAVHAVALAAQSREYRHRLNTFELIVPDGHPVRWALRWIHGIPLEDRVRGADLLPYLCSQAAERGIPIFLYGSSERVVNLLRARLRERFPDLIIAGYKPSLFRPATESERRAIVDEILASGAQLVLVGLGCPRQELWVFEHRHLLRMPLVGMGSAFDTNSGLLPQPPMWIQQNWLEWLWRLRREPKRLWRRYLLLNPLYVACLAAQKFGFARFDDAVPAPPPQTRVA